MRRLAVLSLSLVMVFAGPARAEGGARLQLQSAAGLASESAYLEDLAAGARHWSDHPGGAPEAALVLRWPGRESSIAGAGLVGAIGGAAGLGAGLGFSIGGALAVAAGIVFGFAGGAVLGALAGAFLSAIFSPNSH